MRRRKKDRHLPACVYLKHGRYYYVKKGKWHPLAQDLEKALVEYARLSAPSSGMTELLNRTLENSKVKATTMQQYRLAAERIESAFAEFAPDQVRPTHVAAFLDHYRRTPNMANRMRSVLKVAFDNAVRWGMAESNPVSSIKPFKEPARSRYLTDEEYLAIRAHASDYLKLMMDLAYLTGQRVSDIINLKQADIRAGSIYFEQMKTGQKMEIDINEDLAKAVKAARSLHRVEGMTLFHKGNGKPYSYGAVRDSWARACKKAGIADAQFRDVRAKSATDAEEAGLNPGILLGHQDPNTTKRYLRKKRVLKAVGPKSIRQN